MSSADKTLKSFFFKSSLSIGSDKKLKGREIRPGEVIPLEEGDFKDF
jgi:hypothetical protein